MVKMHTFKTREEWLLHRNQYIGGSDASAIIGVNPWKDNVRLWEEKTGRIEQKDISDNPNVQYGIGVEPIMRELFKLNYPQYEVFYEENNSFTNDRFPWAAASLDGWIVEKNTGRKGIWECKSTEIVSSMAKEKWSGQIPDNYFAQKIHYFGVLEDFDFAHLTAILTFKFEDKELYQQIKNYHIERSEVEADIEYLMKEEYKFYQNVKNDIRPALLLPNI